MAAGEKVFAVALVGLSTNLASPLSWTHHYVWILPMAVAVLSTGVPRWARCRRLLGSLGLCLFAVGRTAGVRGRSFTFLQQVVGNLGPVVGVVLVVGLAAAGG